jgi:hypothetical protein
VVGVGEFLEEACWMVSGVLHKSRIEATSNSSQSSALECSKGIRAAILHFSLLET